MQVGDIDNDDEDGEDAKGEEAHDRFSHGSTYVTSSKKQKVE